MSNITEPRCSTKQKSTDIIPALTKELGELYTPEEVARYLKVNQMTVYNWVKTGKLDCHTLTQGKRKSTVRFDITQIRNFMKSRSNKVRGI